MMAVESVETELSKGYKTLELETDAPLAEVRRVFINLVKTWHPDLYAGNAELKKIAEEKLKAVNTAYAAVKSDLASRNGPVNHIKSENRTSSTDQGKYQGALTSGGMIRGALADSFAWLRNRNILRQLDEYVKYARDESPRLIRIIDQTSPEKKDTSPRVGKDFKTVLREVIAAGPQSFQADQGMI